LEKENDHVAGSCHEHSSPEAARPAAAGRTEQRVIDFAVDPAPRWGDRRGAGAQAERGTDLDGKNAKEIIKEVDLTSPDGAYWSPDGKQIAVVLFNWELDEKGKRRLSDPENANFHIDIMDLDGKNRREVKLADAKVVWIGALGDWR
jgi:hypothetical protein